MAEKINIMVVDDSSVIRKILHKILSSEDLFNIVDTAEDGQVALDKLGKLVGKTDIHVVIMDIEMPVMDGYTALPHVKKLFPKCRVIVASTLTERGAAASMKALSAGASDYLPKPNPSNAGGDSPVNFIDFSKDLVNKVKTLGRAAQSSYDMGRIAGSRSVAPSASGASPAAQQEAKITLRPNRKYRPKALVIGSSTGGPEALQNLFKALDKQRLSGIPIFITQHMPAKFTTLLAANIAKSSGFDCVEASDNEIAVAGKIYVAPGDFHMQAVKRGVDVVIKLNQGPQVNFCRPSVDPMLNSLVDVYGDNLLFVMLTGMGGDGLQSAKNAAARNANVFAQDKETSVVWGMPGAVATAGICSKIAPIPEIASDIMGRF